MRRCTKIVRTLRQRVKDKHARVLGEMARDVNLTWNFCNELSFKILEREHRFCNSAELQKYLNGASREGLRVGSAVFQQVADEYVTRRVQHKKRRLNWRRSGGSRRSLGWIPFKDRAVQYRNGQIHFNGHALGLWDSYGLPQYRLRSGNFSEDSRGRWYLNVTVELPELVGPRPLKPTELGIDLGLKEFAGFSDEGIDNVEAQRFYRELEPALAIAQRAGKKQRVKAIHAKIAHRRKDHQHQLSTALVQRYGAIFVGNVNASGLSKTGMAKSVLDAGWSQFRNSLRYKCADAKVSFSEVDEAFSTQTCSVCNSRTGPKGREGLGIREWVCPECGSTHQRDRNAAKIILAAGRRRLAAGILIASG